MCRNVSCAHKSRAVGFQAYPTRHALPAGFHSYRVQESGARFLFFFSFVPEFILLRAPGPSAVTSPPPPPPRSSVFFLDFHRAWVLAEPHSSDEAKTKVKQHIVVFAAASDPDAVHTSGKVHTRRRLQKCPTVHVTTKTSIVTRFPPKCSKCRIFCHLCEMNTGLLPGSTVSAKLRTSATWSAIFTLTPLLSPYRGGQEQERTRAMPRNEITPHQEAVTTVNNARIAVGYIPDSTVTFNIVTHHTKRRDNLNNRNRRAGRRRRSGNRVGRLGALGNHAQHRYRLGPAPQEQKLPLLP